MEPVPRIGIGGGSKDAAPPIAGKIEAPPSDVREAVDAWLEHLRSRRHKKNGFTAYRQKIERMLRETGIRSCSELTAERLIGWLDSHGERWSGSTYNNAMSVLRSFTGYCAEIGAIPAPVLEGSSRAFEEPAPGSRAATTDEARAILRAAYLRGENDARCKGNRALYWACLLLAGCRLDEPGRWKWKNVLIDEDFPVLRWTPDINKNRRLEECAIAPELLGLLREHRERMRERARTEPEVERLFRGEVVERRRIDPADPEAYVFDRVPTPASFPKDRDRARVARLDSRGRALTSHSCRKWFATTMTRAGVSERLVDRLMRHRGGVQSRYFDPPPEELAGALEALPRLWPAGIGVRAPGRETDPGILSRADLTDRGRIADSLARANEPPESESVSTPGPDRFVRWHAQSDPRPGTEADSLPEHPSRGSRRDPAPLNHRDDSSPEMALSRFINPDDSTAVADLFDALARVLRQGVPRGNEREAGDRAG